MSTIEIAQEAFPWSAAATFACAAATLIAGAAAVLSAAYIGQKQIAITAKQIELISRQTRIQEMNYKEILFERRFSVYKATQDYISAIMRDAASPSISESRDFIISLDQAKFLFNPDVELELQTIWRDAQQLRSTQIKMQASYQRSGDYGSDSIDAESILLMKFADRFNKLADIFGSSLVLID